MPLPAWLTGCLRCTVLSQKGGELGLSILGCELRQWLDKAASGSQPITSLPSVLHSYGCMIGPGVAGRGMDRWWKETRLWKREEVVFYSLLLSYVKTVKQALLFFNFFTWAYCALEFLGMYIFADFLLLNIWQTVVMMHKCEQTEKIGNGRNYLIFQKYYINKL